MKKLEITPDFQDYFAKLGDSWKIEEKLAIDIVEFSFSLMTFPCLKKSVPIKP